MNTQNKEDIPTRNLKKKKKKKKKNILNWRQTTFHVEQKKNKKNEKQQQQKKKKNKKKKQRNTEKNFQMSRRTNFWKTKLDVNTKHVEFLSAKHYLSTLFHFPTCKIR